MIILTPEIAVTLSGFEVAVPLSPPDSDAIFKQFQDSETGVAVSLPGNWVISGIIPGHRATLKSYPEGKYIGGEVIQPGDTKCDLFIRPPDISVVDFVQEMKSNDTITIVSEDEIILQSGQPGTRLEVDSMGLSLSLVTEINARVVVLNCFGELAPFDEIAVTLNASK
jgi:hypothetical protein